MLGGGDRVAARDVHDQHAPSRGGHDVDVVHAGAGAPDRLQGIGGLDDRAGDPGGAADQEDVDALHGEAEFRFRQARPGDHLVPGCLQEFPGALREFVGDQDPGAHVSLRQGIR